MFDKKGQIAIDFLLGISLVLIALGFTIQFIPGLFISGSAGESSLDYTAYRTAAILAEDTGWWENITMNGTDWENHPNGMLRIGLAADDEPRSRLTDTPNLISKKKTEQFLLLNESTITEKLGLYNDVEDSHFAYGYNISILKNDRYLVLNNTTVHRGLPVPDDREMSGITRIVLIETGTVASFDAKELPMDPYSPGSENTILNITGPLNYELTIELDNLNISGVDPSFKKLVLDGTNLNEGTDYTAYKVINGTELPLTSTGKIDSGGTVIFRMDPGLFSGSHTYQLQIDMKDITFTNTAPPFPEYSEQQEILYEPAYLEVVVWQ